MAIRKIARMGHPVLREKCKPIDPEKIRTPEVQGLIRDMLETMIDYNGVGLAAPQVYVPVRLCIAGGDTDDDGQLRLRVLINPEITVLDPDRREGMYEGCLSIPGLRGYVERPAHINVKGYDETGTPLDFDLEGYPAIVMQHECDHLDGVLYVDRIKDMTSLGYEEEVQRYHDLGDEDDDEDDD
jgi:peptide deformylase